MTVCARGVYLELYAHPSWLVCWHNAEPALDTHDWMVICAAAAASVQWRGCLAVVAFAGRDALGLRRAHLCVRQGMVHMLRL
jgi:hypothetical protein